MTVPADPRPAADPHPGADPTWDEQLASSYGGSAPEGLAERYRLRWPPGYRERTSPSDAVVDIAQLEQLSGGAGGTAEARFGGRHGLVVRPEAGGAGGGAFRLRRFGYGGVELTGFLPILESFGLVVIEAVPFWLPTGPNGEERVHIDDFGVRVLSPPGVAPAFHPLDDAGRLVAALEAVADQRCDIDSLNRTVTLAGLSWTEVMVLRAYRRYWRQAGSPLGDRQLDDPLAAHPTLARLLLGYFAARFDPASQADALAEPAARQAVLRALDAVPDLEHDQVLRGYLALMDATVRTSYFRSDGLAGPAASEGPATVALKFDSGRVPGLGAPRPRVETWVHGAAIEGIHLRAGLVARGGLRWSERADDFRTEVLDLAMAQVKKNAIIVPTGAKGGFVCRRSASPSAEVIRASYEVFVQSLLDITDNLVGGEAVPPEGVACHDGADPYLVVAPDKGTAAFSDLANAISEGRGFWLGDAFASGGSRGYDHKAMGITARGAWVAVRRHFHQLGIDVQTEPFRVVGVGDMSGDVFGNGMLRSRSLRLVAAFDHRHIFVDPDPEPSGSFAERERLAGLGRSSWHDYARERISPGGGVWSRQEKRVDLHPAARRALGVDSDSMSPPELISAVLAAPVDLLWFGGIGTYIKAPDESDLAVGDHANDAVRITADQVRARVIAEGGNLGVTQKARIRYSRRGGRINTDFIDNAAGVATSDREVNLKILLALAIEEGQLDPAERDAVLAECEHEVAAAVLRQVDRSVAALNRAVPASAAELDAYQALLEGLEKTGGIDRVVEHLPSDDEIATRREAGAGLIRPELAVLLSYAKSDLVAAIEAAPLVGDPALQDTVLGYFPVSVRQRFGPSIRRHRLYPQLLATELAGEIVDQMGVVWAHETAAELGRDAVDAVAAFWAASVVLDAGSLWVDLEAQSGELSAEAEDEAHGLIIGAVGTLARSYLRRPGRVDPATLVAEDRPLALEVDRSVAASAVGGPRSAQAQTAEDALVAQGVSRALAARVVRAATLGHLADAGAISRACNQPLVAVLEALDGIDAASGAGRLVGRLRSINATGRWASWQARALLDDLDRWRAEAVQRALAEAAGVPPVEVVAAWHARREAALATTGGLIDRLDPARQDALTLAALVLRSLARLG